MKKVNLDKSTKGNIGHAQPRIQYAQPRRVAVAPNANAAQGFLVVIALIVLGGIWLVNFMKDNPAVLIALIIAIFAIATLVTLSKKKSKARTALGNQKSDDVFSESLQNGEVKSEDKGSPIKKNSPKS